MKPAAPSDYRELARRRLPRFLFDYLDGGAYDEQTLRRSTLDLADIALRQRVMRDVSHVDLTTHLLGETLPMPLVLGPVGLTGMNARRGEVRAARAAQKAGIPFTLSTVSICPLEELAGALDRPPWFQLYMIRDRDFMADLLGRARDLGVTHLVFTVDLPVPGTRYRDLRSGLSGSPGLAGRLKRLGQAAMRPRWAWDVGLRGRPHTLGNVAPVLKGRTGLEDFFAWLSDNFDPTVTWDDLDWVRQRWPGKFIIKGILDADDARRAVEAGVDGIVVSNHGGRQLDGVPSTARALPEIAAAVGGDTTVLVDGGVRSGLDVVRMLALGARGVLLGRAWAYALAGGGEQGVSHVLALLEAEMRAAMALTGVTRIADIDSEILVCAR